MSRGSLQKAQADLSKSCGMAALMAQEAGWWQLELLLQALGERAAAGAAAELRQLMELPPPHMTSCRARALYAVGIKSPQQLLEAVGSDKLVKALTASLPRALRPNGSKQQQSRATGAWLSNSNGHHAVVARASRALVDSARQWLERRALELEAASANLLAAQDGDSDSD